MVDISRTHAQYLKSRATIMLMLPGANLLKLESLEEISCSEMPEWCGSQGMAVVFSILWHMA